VVLLAVALLVAVSPAARLSYLPQCPAALWSNLHLESEEVLVLVA